MAKPSNELATQLSRRWVWKDETNTLEPVSNNQGSIDKGLLTAARAKKGKGLGITFQDLSKKNDRATPSVLSKNYGGVGGGSRRGQALLTVQRTSNFKGTSPRPSLKTGTEHATVTLDDVKSVALDSIPDMDILPSAFQGCYSSEQFDEFLLAVLNYFNAFLDKMELENKPKPMACEPSLEERKNLAMAQTKQEAAQKLLSQSYCTLVLGLGLQDKHHLACGKSRSSNTNQDREMYETLYTFAAQVTHIAFKRQHLTIIQKELGRMFRSDTFNPAGRPKDIEEVYAIDRLKDNSKAPLTPAEYRRLKPKRPAIKSIVNQRSPVLVSLLPTSQESSPWYLDRTRALPVSADELPHDEDKLNSRLQTKVGIIGEPMAGFNPLTLVPFGEGQEDNGHESESRRDSIAREPGTVPVQGGAMSGDELPDAKEEV